MANSHGSGQQRSEFICVDPARDAHQTASQGSEKSNVNKGGGYLYTTELEEGSLDPTLYPKNREIGCAVCSNNKQTGVYVRWGSLQCPEQTTNLLYVGQILGAAHNQAGSGYNWLCIHDRPEWPRGFSNANQDTGARVYGAEYEPTGVLDKNKNWDAGCAVCQLKHSVSAYVQWGRRTCTEDHKTEYTGLVMSSHHTHWASGTICVDLANEGHKNFDSKNVKDRGQALLYTTEMQKGAADESLYKHQVEVSCAVCSPINRLFPCPSLADNKKTMIADKNECGEGKHNGMCTFACEPGHAATGEDEYVCDGHTGKWTKGSLSCKANIKCSAYTCKAGYLKADAANIDGADDTTCCDTIRTVVFTRWGSQKCPEGTKYLYDGFIASSSYTHNGGGANYICMHPEPQYPEGYLNTNENGNMLYGTEYQETGAVDNQVDQDAACAVCEHPMASNVYVQWGRTDCSTDHQTLYDGIIMATYYTQQRSTNICVDMEFAAHPGSSGSDEQGALLYSSEMESGGSAWTDGASDESMYPPNRELACALCAPKTVGNAVYTRWGHRSCPETSARVYEGFMSSAKSTNCGKTSCEGGGANFICMHNMPQWPEGYNNGDHNGNRLWGVEYRNTGAVDANNHQDAACVVCETQNIAYVQWGRQTCSNGHVTHYNGLVMAYSHTQWKSSYVCVDWLRDSHPTSYTKENEWAGFLYTTEMESGSADEKLYPTNREVGCVVCSPENRVAVYTQWGAQECTDSAKKLYSGFMAGPMHNYEGSGYNLLCMHNDPQYPRGYDDGNHDGGAWLVGWEYNSNTAKLIKDADGGYLKDHFNKDVGCVVCEHKQSTGVYVQWGRRECTNGHHLEYYGIIMSSYYGHQKAENVCVDLEFASFPGSNPESNEDGLLYQTEMELGASDEAQYRTDVEVSCAVCSTVKK
jgi:hypothetical protein